MSTWNYAFLILFKSISMSVVIFKFLWGSFIIGQSANPIMSLISNLHETLAVNACKIDA